ncbi:hypothetical protein PGR6_15970 [Pseudomonas sp. GR 6-02]|nr:hypothetical protein PGR6_15970 [Pseudomonas sp. GR 6-02]
MTRFNNAPNEGLASIAMVVRRELASFFDTQRRRVGILASAIVSTAGPRHFSRARAVLPARLSTIFEV